MDSQAFSFELPAHLIAQYPPAHREEARLCCLRPGQKPIHHLISSLPEYVRPGDLWVFNNTKVVKARLLGKKRKTGGHIELLIIEPSTPGLLMKEALLKPLGELPWRCLGKASKGFKPGEALDIGGATALVCAQEKEGLLLIRFEGEGTLSSLLENAGHMPLPPYVRRIPNPEDTLRYQTVFAQTEGSVAAPTAGLHFTPALMQALQNTGAGLAFIRLDIGLGTFLPIRTPRIEEHLMHEENCSLPQETAQALNQTRAQGGRVVAVGTTVVRCLESFADASGHIEAGNRRTNIFIYPGYRFRVVQAMLTNFHLPGSTLLMLVAAFAGTAQTLAAYGEAIERGYRFYSFGDAMLLEKTAPQQAPRKTQEQLKEQAR
ncbi:MAG: tRNA preQ1(34) S-adenosylmethionine ribosyltransferase-isomerase QueA [Cystobacterineae bacterium]|nr:tRNA preQ1(34) S-adenosylmethionine ribosyltransferase-isomerase QueA [Cystobacterineae bacterium]